MRYKRLSEHLQINNSPAKLKEFGAFKFQAGPAGLIECGLFSNVIEIS